MNTKTLHLSSTPKIITLEPAPLLYLQKIGPFIKNAPLAWKEFWHIVGGKIEQNQMAGMVGLGRIDHTKTGDDAFIYRAGVVLHQMPDNVPAGLQRGVLPQGNYACFLLTGSYSQLPSAYPAIFAMTDKEKLYVRSDDFCIERYLNNPQTTPEEQLETEILIPIR
jgi:AraC family transcriptional regulator